MKLKAKEALDTCGETYYNLATEPEKDPKSDYNQTLQ
jgi:hypothetical protein